jgi:glycosyltransferase involved in cell wall biosynthesis
MRRLKIAFLSRWYWEENRRTGTAAGGPTQQLAEAVAALGHEVTVLSQSPRIAALEKSRIGALDVWLSPREKRRDFFTGLRDKLAKGAYRHRKVHSDALDLAEFLRTQGPFDVLWAHCEEPDGLVAGVAARRGVRLPPLLVQVQALRYRFENGAPVFTEQLALRLAFRHADRIIANSALVADSLAAYAGPGLPADRLREKVGVVYPNLQREFLEAALGPGPSPEPGRVLFLGALNEKKGAVVFLEAVARSGAAKREGARFVVAGAFTENNPAFARRWEAALATAAPRLAPGSLELPGKISATDAIREIQRAAVVVFPSLFDEFSRAVVEALVLGRPVITTTAVGAAPLVTEHDGLVVAPNDSAALAGAIDAMLRAGPSRAANAGELAHQLGREISPEAAALQLSRHFEELAGP